MGSIIFMLRLSIRTDLQQDSIHHRRLEAFGDTGDAFCVSSPDGSTAAQSFTVKFCIVAVTYSQAACLVGDRICNYAIRSNELRRLNPRNDIATHSFPVSNRALGESNR